MRFSLKQLTSRKRTLMGFDTGEARFLVIHREVQRSTLGPAIRSSAPFLHPFLSHVLINSLQCIRAGQAHPWSAQEISSFTWWSKKKESRKFHFLMFFLTLIMSTEDGQMYRFYWARFVENKQTQRAMSKISKQDVTVGQRQKLSYHCQETRDPYQAPSRYKAQD